MKRLVIVVLGLTVLFNIPSCDTTDNDKFRSDKTVSHEDAKVENVILLIGDGMGTAQFYAGMATAENSLTVEEFKHIGFQKTYSDDDFITCSAASGTAIATGTKTNNGYIGMSPEEKDLKTILEIAEQSGYGTGLVSTSAIVHATPAAFIAHNKSRNNYEEIAADFLKTDIDVFIGGGEKYFNQREDGKNLVDSLKNKGYRVGFDLDEFKGVDNGKLAVLTAEGHNPRYSEGRDDMLPDATKIAVDVLDNEENGFFLMVEGSQVDWGGHDQDIDYVMEEIEDFENAIKVAKEYADKNENTLVIVTADHECGGMTLTGGDIEKGEVEVHFSSDGHTGVMVPVFAFGAGASEFQGVYENTDIFHKLKKLYGFESSGK
ncbi:MAG: alkaline phosphatase [Bacteroidales bacterium]